MFILVLFFVCIELYTFYEITAKINRFSVEVFIVGMIPYGE